MKCIKCGSELVEPEIIIEDGEDLFFCPNCKEYFRKNMLDNQNKTYPYKQLDLEDKGLNVNCESKRFIQIKMAIIFIYLISIVSAIMGASMGFNSSYLDIYNNYIYKISDYECGFIPFAGLLSMVGGFYLFLNYKKSIKHIIGTICALLDSMILMSLSIIMSYDSTLYYWLFCLPCVGLNIVCLALVCHLYRFYNEHGVLKNRVIHDNQNDNNNSLTEDNKNDSNYNEDLNINNLYDNLKKIKELYDMSIIGEEEYTSMKKNFLKRIIT